MRNSPFDNTSGRRALMALLAIAVISARDQRLAQQQPDRAILTQPVATGQTPQGA